MDPQGPLGPVVTVYSLHVKCPIFSAMDHEDAESRLLHSSDWMKSQEIAEEGKCCMFCLAPAGDAQIWYE